MNAFSTTKKYAFVLGFFALFCVVFSSVIFFNADPFIKASEKAYSEKNLKVVLNQHFNQNILKNCYVLEDNRYPFLDKIYFAKNGEKLTALAIISHTFEGYSGKISLIQGFDNTGKILGVRILNHSETPGLGDKIELKKSDWILSFNGKQLDKNNLELFAVKKDGGNFDSFTGATITPRAIIKNIKQTSLFLIDDFFKNPHQMQQWRQCED